MTIEKHGRQLTAAPELETPQGFAPVCEVPKTLICQFPAPAQVKRLQPTCEAKGAHLAT